MIRQVSRFLMLLVIALAGIRGPHEQPNAIPQAKQLLQYLVNLSGQKILSGQESMFSAGAFPSSDDKTYFKNRKIPGDLHIGFGDVNTATFPTATKWSQTPYRTMPKAPSLRFNIIWPNPTFRRSGFSAMNIKGSTWHGFESTTYNSDALYTKNYGDPSLITQDEVSIRRRRFSLCKQFRQWRKPWPYRLKKRRICYILCKVALSKIAAGICLPEGSISVITGGGQGSC